MPELFLDNSRVNPVAHRKRGPRVAKPVKGNDEHVPRHAPAKEFTRHTIRVQGKPSLITKDDTIGRGLPQAQQAALSELFSPV